MYLYSGEYSIQVNLEPFYVQHYQSKNDDGDDATPPQPFTASLLVSEPSDDPVSKAEAHTLVYKAADKFDISNLKAHAYERFRDDLKYEVFCDPKLPSMASLVYESTSAHDLEL